MLRIALKKKKRRSSVEVNATNVMKKVTSLKTVPVVPPLFRQRQLIGLISIFLSFCILPSFESFWILFNLTIIVL